MGLHRPYLAGVLLLLLLSSWISLKTGSRISQTGLNITIWQRMTLNF